MTLKEHLQFLAMMIPTLLLLVAVAATLAFPAGRVGDAVSLVHSEAEAGAASAQSADTAHDR